MKETLLGMETRTYLGARFIHNMWTNNEAIHRRQHVLTFDFANFHVIILISLHILLLEGHFILYYSGS